MKKSVFVQIASYRDPELLNTITDIIDKCSNTIKLNIVVCWQHGDEQSIEDFLDKNFNIDQVEKTSAMHDLILLSKGSHTLKLIDVPYFDSKGACWARNYIQSLYKNEDYTLQLDSHHRFIQDWDLVILEMYTDLVKLGYKPLLTAYLPSYDPERDPEGRVNAPWRMNFDRFIPEGAVFFIPETIPDYANLDLPVPARFYSAHFAFTDGAFSKVVKHDPDYFFHGEEISIAARAYTHGYDLFHPHKVIAWHEYTRKNRVKMWDDHVDSNKIKGKIELNWSERNKLSHEKNRRLFSMDGQPYDQFIFGQYGFGAIRSLKQYERYSGLSFKFRSVTKDTIDKKYPDHSNPDLTMTDAEWESTLSISNDVRILIHKNEIPKDDSYDFFFVGAHDIHGNEIYRKDWNKEEIDTVLNILKGDWIDRRLIFLSKTPAHTYTIWPHSLKTGWGTRIVKSVEK